MRKLESAKSPAKSYSHKSSFHRTTNLYEAAFLLARGFILNDVDRNEGRKVVIFVEGEEIQSSVHDYYNGGLVGGKAMTDAYRMLKDRIFE